MYSATFTFVAGAFDDAFHALDAQIATLAKSIPGYLGEEVWENPNTGQVANVYYWETLEALQVLINHPLHFVAKENQAKWLKGYQVVVSQVLRVYGDGGIAHPLACLSTTSQHALAQKNNP